MNLFVTGDDDDDGGEEGEEPNPDEEPPTPSCSDYIMHFVTLFWKLLFAFIPPTGKHQITISIYRSIYFFHFQNFRHVWWIFVLRDFNSLHWYRDGSYR
jgi:hypothetical protein